MGVRIYPWAFPSAEPRFNYGVGRKDKPAACGAQQPVVSPKRIEDMFEPHNSA
jgi:hypothetical protein